jgi:cell division protein FtsA
MPKNSYIVGLDIGTKKVAAIIGEITEDYKVEVIGIGTAESKGLRKGVVVNLEATTAAIKKAQEEAELMAGVEIDSAFVGISGAHIKSLTAAASSPSPERTGRSRAKTSAGSSINPRPSPSRPTGTSST